jgi:hypothetical protein
MQELGKTAHADTADADKVYMAGVIKVDVSHCQCPFLYACYEAITAYIIYLFAGYVNKDF